MKNIFFHDGCGCGGDKKNSGGCCQEDNASSLSEEPADLVLSVGDYVPSFTTPSYFHPSKETGKYTYRPGKPTVLFFYPANFTFV